jgi:hypothetical protein
MISIKSFKHSEKIKRPILHFQLGRDGHGQNKKKHCNKPKLK